MHELSKLENPRDSINNLRVSQNGPDLTGSHRPDPKDLATSEVAEASDSSGELSSVDLQSLGPSAFIENLQRYRHIKKQKLKIDQTRRSIDRKILADRYNQKLKMRLGPGQIQVTIRSQYDAYDCDTYDKAYVNLEDAEIDDIVEAFGSDRRSRHRKSPKMFSPRCRVVSKEGRRLLTVMDVDLPDAPEYTLTSRRHSRLSDIIRRPQLET